MAYDYNRLFEKIIAAIASDGTITKRMNLVIEECARQRPHADWIDLSRIDFDGDSKALNQWLQVAFAHANSKEIRSGLWFGIFNPANENGEATADLYVGVSPDFEETSNEWAGDIEERELANYLDSNVLARIYSIAYDAPSGLGNDAEYPLALAYAGMAAHSILSVNDMPAALQGLKGAAVGFDSGDLLFLGEFVASQFISNVRAG
jgi:hypothetical protein